MNFIKFKIFCVFFAMFVFVPFIFCEDLKIEEGKNLKFDFKGLNSWYDDTKLYDNVNIGAGTKVVLGGQWEYVFVSSSLVNVEYTNREVVVPGSTETYKVQDETYNYDYSYRKDENIATLSIAQNGEIRLNSGSELSIRNQYSLITSTQDVSLKYIEVGDNVVLDEGYESNLDSLVGYLQYDDSGSIVNAFANRELKNSVETFGGDIVFVGGDEAETVLTFQQINTSVSQIFTLPEASAKKVIGKTSTDGDKIDLDKISDSSPKEDPSNDYDKTIMTNNFVIDSNRAVFNVLSGYTGTTYDSNKGSVILTSKGFGKTSYITGNGCIVKKGAGILNLDYDVNSITGEIKKVDSTGLTGSNVDGCGWIIEEGGLLVHDQVNVGSSDIKIDEKGNLRLGTILTSLTNDIGFLGNGTYGEVILSGGTSVILSGKISTNHDAGGVAKFIFNGNSELTLTETSDAENFYLSFFDKNNKLTADVDALATKNINVVNSSQENKEFAFFELVMNENENKEYSGSLQGEMYLRKTGSGIVTLSGENTYTKGTYITQGGLLLATSNALGTGNILFDGGVKGSSSTYSYIGVSSTTTGDIVMTNNIHVKNGAILDVYENQKMTLLGDIVSYDIGAGNETEFIKTGLGESTISGTLDTNKQVTISSFSVTEGGFVLDKNIVLNSYFSLDGQKAYLKMCEKAGIKNNIDIYNGDLIIFNEKNISSSTAVNFYNVSISTENFSKLHISSDSTFSKPNLINIAKNIEFVIDATTTAKMDSFNFASGANTTIVKSGDGLFVADNKSNDFNLENLYVNGGTLRLDNTNMSISSNTTIDGGILRISSSSHFASTATAEEDRKITILNGGIGIYNNDSIDTNTKLSFEGTDSENLSKLIVEDAVDELSNNIYVKTGVIIENEKDLTFSGNSISGDYGIIAKSGAGTMIINTIETFSMGEIRALEGNLLVKSDVSVSTISIAGKNAILSFDNIDNADISEKISISNNGLLSIATSTVNAKNIDILNSTTTLMKSQLTTTKIDVMTSTMTLTESNVSYADIDVMNSIMTLTDSDMTSLDISAETNVINSTMTLTNSSMISANIDVVNSTMTLTNSNIISTNIDVTNSIMKLKDENSEINTTNINVIGKSLIYGIGNYNSTINMKNGSIMCIGEDKKSPTPLSYSYNREKANALMLANETLEMEKIKADSIIFEEGSSLKIDVKSEYGITSSDKLILSGDITVQKNVILDVNVMGDTSEYETTKLFEFITYSGTGTFENSSNEIFNILLTNSRMSATTLLEGNSILLQIVQKFSSYDIPGLSVNQQNMTDSLNKISSDKVAHDKLQDTLGVMDSLYSTYRETGDKTEFVNALQDLSGIFYANSFMTSSLLSNLKTNIVYNRIDKSIEESENENNVWAQVYTNKFNVAKNEENPEFEDNIYGMIAGYDTVYDDKTIIGFSGFYGQGEMKQLEDKANVIDAGVNVYANYKANDNIDIRGLIGYSMQDYDTTRKLRFIKNQEIKSKYAARTASFGLEASYRFDLSNSVALKPILGANCEVVSNGDIEEDGTTEQRLKIKENTYTQAAAKVGFGLQSRNASQFNWHLLAFAKQILVGEQFKTKASFANIEKYDFEIESTKLPVTSFVGNIGCSYDISSAVCLSLDLNADTGSTTMFGGNIGATYRW